MREMRRKVLLPVFQLSELTTKDDPRALTRSIKQGKGHSALTYHYRLIQSQDTGHGFNYNLFPVVLDSQSAPWPLGTLYILAQLEGESHPSMTTYQSKADDLGAYKEWLDQQGHPDELLFLFPKIKLRRPTYRYRGYLQLQVQAGEIALSTAKRRMATIVGFYRWLIEKDYLKPEYPPWEERQYQLLLKSKEGLHISKKIISTDVNISTPYTDDPFAGTIQDGGKLRPLSLKEQNWILEAAKIAGNTECYLIQLFMLATGARIQTAGTLRIRHFLQSNPGYSKALTGDGEVYKLKAGPGTGIDTKNNKNGVLQVPRPVYDLLHTYALSERAKLRRNRFLAKYTEHLDPYLFLTQQGSPYYTGMAESHRFNMNFDSRHEKTGQTIRQFIKDYVIPYVKKHYDKNFQYRIHDLRASFGMNMTELLMEGVEKKVISLNRVRIIVKDLLWHESLATTDLYLNYRNQMDSIYAAVNDYGMQLQLWINVAMNRIELKDE